MDTMLYDLSIPAISSLQASMAGQAPFMQLMSTVFDPKYAFLIYSPLAYLLDPQVGKRLIMTTVLAEWINMILKWMLHGERPYWYVHSSGHHDPSETPIKQFPITCELGPGHPSGHAMVTAAVWYVILSALYEAYAQHQRQQKQDPTVRPGRAVGAATWTLYATLLTIVSVSRVFLGCHFPHQCVAGAALGLLVARWVASWPHINARHFVFASGLLLTTAFGTYALMQALGLDPSWTIKLATKHCVKREYIHLDTAPFFSIMRYCGFALGAGLGLMLPLAHNSPLTATTESASSNISSPSSSSSHKDELVANEVMGLATTCELEDSKGPLSSRNISWFSFKLIMALLMARLVDQLGLFVSHSNLSVFYACAFAAYTLFSYAFINL